MRLAKEMSIKGVAEIVGEHDTIIWRIITHYVEEARKREDYSEIKKVGMVGSRPKPATPTSSAATNPFNLLTVDQGIVSSYNMLEKDMGIDEIVISKAIIETFYKGLLEDLETKVVIAGAGPSGLSCAYYLARAKVKTVVFERSLRLGGGMPGGGMMFNQIVVQTEAKSILDELGVRSREYKPGYYTASALETAGLLAARAIQAGAKIYNLIAVEDVMMRGEAICGLVVNWSAVESSRLHVDPLSIQSSVVIDATGHQAEVVRIVERKGIRLLTPTGRVMGEGAMWAEAGERHILENTKEAYPGLFVCGMAANAVFGGPRMGPIFGGMLRSGQKAARLIEEYLKDKV